MINKIINFGYFSNINNSPTNYSPNIKKISTLTPLSRDTVSFTGMSLPSQYKSVFDYLAAEIVGKNKKWQVDGSMLSATNIPAAIERLFKLNKVYGPYTESNPNKINWKNYIPEDVRTYCTDKINEARAGRLKQWQTFLENPDSGKYSQNFPQLSNEVKQDKSLRFVIWNAVNSELKATNRHIPVPFDLKALDETVKHFKRIEPKFRAVTCASPSFLEMYTHRLRDNLLMEKGLSDNSSVWIKIPSIKKDLDKVKENISALEILSYKNWCTRSRLDKAEAALEDGDFYIYLERDKNNNIWHSLLGMTTLKGKIDQIQGIENNNFIPLTEIKNITEYLKSQGLKCQSGLTDEGPKALQQILIAEKLAKPDPEVGKTLGKAIKDDDVPAILKILGQKFNYTPDGLLEIGSYKPKVLLSAKSGISVPYTFMGIDEDILLSKVKTINGDFIMHNKNKLYNTSITTFPKNLEKVTGRIVCSEEQFAKYSQDILRVTDGNRNNIIIHE